MRAALVREIGQPPQTGEVEEPPASDDREPLQVLAAGLNPIDIAVSAGRYFGGHPELPYVPGAEGVARLPDGRLGYLHGDGLGTVRNGTFAERVLFDSAQAFAVPEGLAPELAGSIGAAGLAGFVPLTSLAPVETDDVVLVLGATGTAGIVAVQTARLLGAARIVAAGRDEPALERARARGADEVVRLGEGVDLAAALRDACGGEGPTLVFDPLWGEPARAAVEAAAPRARIVNLGQSAGPEATLRSGAVRGKALRILGYQNFGVPRDELAKQYFRLGEHVARGDIVVDVETVPLAEVADAWRRQAASPHVKLVIRPDA
ncbi:MAG TPA: zinc-binding dehydrogenase [Gaiellaceae bacterium]|nr:zinc-binding dehydrogenase [Gaiellaceae bacterium]